MLCVLNCRSARSDSPDVLLREATRAYEAGDQKAAQSIASEGRARTPTGSELNIAFGLELARIDLLQGHAAEALKLLSEPPATTLDDLLSIKREALRFRALNSLGLTSDARKVLADASHLEHGRPSVDLEAVRGELLRQDGDSNGALNRFRNALHLAEAQHDRYRQISLLLSIGRAETDSEHFDEALESLHRAVPLAERLGNRVIHEKLIGDLGWAQIGLGDYLSAEKNFREAASEAQTLLLDADVTFWSEDEGYAKSLNGDIQGARQIYETILKQARQRKDSSQVADTQTDLGLIFLQTKDPSAAAPHLADAAKLYETDRNDQMLLLVHLLQATSEARYGSQEQAAARLLDIDGSASASPSLRWQAEQELALLAARGGNDRATHLWFDRAIRTFQQQQCSVHDITSKLPFQENGTGLYRSYVEHLIQEGRIDDALMMYDQGRATTLRNCQSSTGSVAVAQHQGAPNPRLLATRLKGTLLIYYPLPEVTYLWAVSREHTGFYKLPGEDSLNRLVRTHQELVTNSKSDPIEQGDEAGRTLYDTLIGPAQGEIKPQEGVYVFADRGLSRLNFDTLIVPGAHPHYWVEDVTITNAASLRLLDASLARPFRKRPTSILVLGDPAYPKGDIEALPHAAEEVRRVGAHFPPERSTVLTGVSATSSAYESHQPGHYSNIHIVAHAEPNLNAPMESYVLLAGASDKLYAHEVLRHTLNADLVVLSTCFSSGTRPMPGEGVVGMAWAFERAGSRNVIGALWEVSDDSSPELMDHLYADIESGKRPAQALRDAKLAALHSPKYSKPYYWAPFQLYSNSGGDRTH